MVFEYSFESTIDDVLLQPLLAKLPTTYQVSLSIRCLQTAGDLKGLPLRKIQDTFSSSSFLIIDEYSMVGFRLLAQIDKRLCQATDRISELFGGVSIILVGDILQLPPFGDKPLYHVASVRFKIFNYTNIPFS